MISGEMFASMSVLLSLPKHGDSICVSFEFLYTKGVQDLIESMRLTFEFMYTLGFQGSGHKWSVAMITCIHLWGISCT